jgi:hypothetical protein
MCRSRTSSLKAEYMSRHPIDDINTLLVPWDDIISVFRRASPKPGEYGRGDLGGQTPKMLRLLADADLVERVAKEVFNAKLSYERDTKAAREVISKAAQRYNDTISTVVKSID